MSKSLTAKEIIGKIKEKREEYDRLYPLEGRRWYISTGQTTTQYPIEHTYEFHFLINSKLVLDEVLTGVLEGDNYTPVEIKKILGQKNAPVYLFNYCFYFE